MDLSYRRTWASRSPTRSCPGRRRSWTTSTSSAASRTPGASAIVMHSLFEEQVRGEQMAAQRHFDEPGESFAEALSYFPDRRRRSGCGSDAYLDRLRRDPRGGGGARHRLAQRHRRRAAGSTTRATSRRPAPTPSSSTSTRSRPTRARTPRVESRAVDVVREVQPASAHPGGREALAVLLVAAPRSCAGSRRRARTAWCSSTASTSPTSTPRRSTSCARSSSPTRASCRSGCASSRSSSATSRTSLAATGGVHTALDAVKAIMAGAQRRADGLGAAAPGARAPRDASSQDLARWLEEHEYESLAARRSAA